MWLEAHKRDSLPKPSSAVKLRMSQGMKVGDLAQTYFPGGLDAHCRGDKKAEAKKTKEFLPKKKIIYEAGFMKGSLYARADILRPVGDKWDIIEVKSATKVQPKYVDDIAFQYYVYKKAGLKINKCYLMHCNRDFVKKGKINVKKFFKLTDVTEKVLERVKDLPYFVPEMVKVLSSSKKT